MTMDEESVARERQYEDDLSAVIAAGLDWAHDRGYSAATQKWAETTSRAEMNTKLLKERDELKERVVWLEAQLEGAKALIAMQKKQKKR